jgi:hypothetical protein
MSGGMSTSGISGDHSHKSDKYDTFFVEDLTPHLKSTFAFSQGGANNIEIPFSFSVPANALKSCQGKYARIIYELEVVARHGKVEKGLSLHPTIFCHQPKDGL